MNGILIWLAEVEPGDLPGAKGWPANGQLDVFVVVGALALIVLLVLIWAVAIRKPSRRHRRHRHHRGSRQWGMNPDAEPEAEAGPDGKPGETRHRRRRRDHRSRNPTLAETGGLPPIRGEKPPGDSPV